jgi:Ca-activated chloride channel family protein
MPTRPPVFVVAFAALVCTAPEVPGAQARERVAYVSVVDRQSGQPRLDVSADDIEIREDRVAREVLRVTPATGPFPIAVLVDTSAATEPAVPDIRAALTAFRTALGDLGPVALIGFGDRPTVLAEFSMQPQTFAAGVGRVFQRPGAGATLLEAVSEAATGMARRESERAALVVLTAGGRELSTLYAATVMTRLRESGAALHAVTLLTAARDRSSFSDAERQRDILLDRAARETGGARHNVVSSQGFTTAMSGVGRLLAHQYRVVYARPPSLLPPETFEVRATARGFVAYGTTARGQSQ